jgi:hypothetical protein
MSRPPFIRRGAWRHLTVAGAHLWLALRHVGAALWSLLSQGLAAVVALVVIFEEWGWKPLAAWLGRLARLRPIAALESRIARLPPYAALAVFGLPSLLLLPLKLLSFYLIAQGYKAAAATLFVGAKVIGTALVARLYILTQAALMRIGWFKRAYDLLMPIKAALLEWVRASAVWRAGRLVKARLRRRLAPIVGAVRATLARWFGRRPAP